MGRLGSFLLLAQRAHQKGRNDTHIAPVLPECARTREGRVWRLLVSCARAVRTKRVRAARWSLVLAQRPHRNDRMSTLRAVRVDARTFETNQAILLHTKISYASR